PQQTRNETIIHAVKFGTCRKANVENKNSDDAHRVSLNVERIKYWLSVGAQITDRVRLFLSDAGLIAKPVLTEKPKQSAPKAKAVARAAEIAQKLADAKEAERAAKEEAEATAKAENEAKVETIAEPVAESAVEMPEEPAADVVSEQAPVVETPVAESASESEKTPESTETPAA
ncbi:MAG: 30S ribosomal protein S16, partial [Rickettsiales bacterium]|nr:30S ribosomal protein S16 [Rickettsiales bacterium]